MEKKILIVLPYSGAQFTGGLAVVNEQLTKALAADHKVKLLIYELEDSAMPTPQGHGEAEILVIKSNETKAMKNPGGKDGGEHRKRLYELINSPDVILGQEVKELLNGWKPDYILGHSRFSGPAAILLRDNLFKDAKVGYFFHSYPPVEGMLLRGYEAFEEKVDINSAQQKLDEEAGWIYDADVVLAMGPLMRWGATLMLESKGVKNPRVHEVISGVTADKQKLPKVNEKEEVTEVTPDEQKLPKVNEKEEVTLILSGRASAPVKGFQDIVVAALQLRNAAPEAMKLEKHVCIKVLGMNETTFPPYTDHQQLEPKQRTVSAQTVQEWVDGLFGERKDGDAVRIQVLPMVPQNKVMEAYRSAHGVLSAAYLEHFGLVPFEALSCRRPVLVSELSGSGQFLMSRYGDLGKECVVQDFAPNYPRPLTNAVLKSIASDAFDNRPNAWQNAIRDLVNNIQMRIENADKLADKLMKEYTIENFAQSVVAAFDNEWDGKITWQIADGKVEVVPSEKQ